MKILLLQAWQATQTNFELNLQHKTIAPLHPQPVPLSLLIGFLAAAHTPSTLAFRVHIISTQMKQSVNVLIILDVTQDVLRQFVWPQTSAGPPGDILIKPRQMSFPLN